METMQLIPDVPLSPDDIENLTVSLADLPPDDQLPGDLSSGIVKSIERFGLLEPILLIRRPDGGYDVAAGRRRIKAARLAGLLVAPARIFPAGWTALEVISLIENEQRSENATSDLHAIEKLLAVPGTAVRDIAAATGMPTGVIRKRMKLLRLVPDLRAALDAGKIRGTIAYELTLLDAERQQELADKLARDGKLARADIRAASQARTAAIAGDLATLFATPGVEQADAEPRELTAADYCDLAIKALPPDTPASYVASLKKLTAWAQKRVDNSD